jgi:hypothetical protein
VKEALGGYLFFEAENLDAAIELAARKPPRKPSRPRPSAGPARVRPPTRAPGW